MKSLATAHIRPTVGRSFTIQRLRAVVVFLLVAMTTACEDDLPTAPIVVDTPQFTHISPGPSRWDPQHIDFSALPAISVTYAEKGFRFTASRPYSSNFNLTRVWGHSMSVRSGGTYVTIRHEGGAPFKLLSFRAAARTGGSKTLTLIGTRSDGSTVSQTFTINGSWFRTLTLDASFSELVSLYWNSPIVVYDDFMLQVPPPPPEADAGDDQTLTWAQGLTATLDGSGSVDVSGQPTHYEWADSEGNVLGSSTSVLVPMADLGSFTYTLTVENAWGTTDTDNVTITVVNPPPVADAGADQRVEWTRENAGATTLDGSGTTDPNDDALTYTWTNAAGDVLAEGVTPTVDLGLGTHTITLTVADPHGATDTDVVQIILEDTTPPEVTAELIPVVGRSLKHNKGQFTVRFSCSDACDSDPELVSALLNDVAVTDGQVVDLRLKSERSSKSDKSEKSKKSGKSDKPTKIEGTSFELVVQCVDESGNIGIATAEPVFAEKSEKRRRGRGE
jgi:K319-like protein